MVSVPNPRTWVDREIPPYSTYSTEIYGTLSWLLQPPMCKLRQTTGQSIGNASWSELNFQTEDVDPYNWHNSTNITRITPTFPGWYRGWYGIGFSVATGGNFRDGYVGKNGGTTRARRDTKPPTTGSNASLRGIPFFLPMNGTTDYFEVFAYQDSGSSMTLSTTAFIQTEVFCRYWGPL